jgi:predicted nucleotidyltransferase
MPYGLKEEFVKQIQHVFSNFPGIERVTLYGSRAMGTFKPGSDIDLTLEGEGLNLQFLSRLDDELDELNSPYTFDLSLRKQIENPDLLEHIRRVGVLFYQK